MIDANSLHADALAKMNAGDFAGARALLLEIHDRHQQGDGSISEGQAAHVGGQIGVCYREEGNAQEAERWFAQTSQSFLHSMDSESIYGAALADYLLAEMYESQGLTQKARDLFEHVSFRTMATDHCQTKAIFHNTMRRLKQFEGEGSGTATGAPAATAFTYSKRMNMLEKEARSWRFEDNHIICSRNGSEATLPYDVIKRIHLSFAPTRPARNRYQAVIETKGGMRETIDNMHYAGLADFEDRSSEYREAILTLLARLKALDLPVEVVSGKSWPVYILWAVTSAISMLVIFFALLAGGIVGLGINGLLAFFYLPTLYRWFKRNMPQTGALDAPPPGSLP